MPSRIFLREPRMLGEDEVDRSANAPLGMGLVCGAGAATGIGAAVVFNEKLISLASKQVLAAGLGISAGVMLYVSFIEIFYKAVDGFGGAGYSEEDSYLLATMCFFLGVVLMKIIDFLVHKIDPSHDCSGEDVAPQGSSAGTSSTDVQVSVGEGNVQDPSQPADFKKDAENAKKLKRMGLNTALAIAIHNFPEGLATFVGTLDDPAVGASLAIAIAIHNVPEGLCVAVPVYYSTGNRWKAFGWGILSGISEPIGAALGWAILMNEMTEDAYGALFGLVGGMMVAIVMHELLPTAHRYDQQDKWVTNCVITGMMIMAASLIMFMY